MSKCRVTGVGLGPQAVTSRASRTNDKIFLKVFILLSCREDDAGFDLFRMVNVVPMKMLRAGVICGADNLKKNLDVLLLKIH